MRLLFILIIFCSTICKAQTDVVIFAAVPGTKADTASYEKYKDVPPVDMSKLPATTSPVVYLYDGYMIAKCVISVRNCNVCPPYQIKCYRREDGLARTFWTDKDCKNKKINFSRSFIFWEWINKDWK